MMMVKMIMQLLPMAAVQYIYILRLTGDDNRDRDFHDGDDGADDNVYGDDDRDDKSYGNFHDGDDDDDGDRKTSQRAKSQVIIWDFV